MRILLKNKTTPFNSCLAVNQWVRRRFLCIALLSSVFGLSMRLSAAEPDEAVQRFDWRVSPVVEAQWSYRGPSGVAVDRRGRVLVADAFNGRVLVFNRQAERIGVFADIADWRELLDRPQGLVSGPDDSLYVVDVGRHQILHLSKTGEVLAQWGGRGVGDGQMHRPRDIARDRDGLLYVTDTLNRRVQVFSGQGEFQRAWPIGDADGGEVTWPSGVAVGRDGSVWVSDSLNHRLLRFDKRGSLLGEVRRDKEVPLNWPTDLDVDEDGNLYVASEGNGRILVFSPEGTLRKVQGGDGVHDLRFDRLRGLAVSEHGTIYAVDDQGNTLVGVGADGAALAQAKVSGEGDFKRPQRLAIDAARNQLYVTDEELSRIQVLDLETGTLVRQWGGYAVSREAGNFRFKHEFSDLAIDSDGLAHIASRGLTVYDQNGILLREVEVEGIPRTQKVNIRIDSRDRRIIAAAGSFHVFDAQGNRLETIELQDRKPNHIASWALDHEDNLYVFGSRGALEILKYAPDGRFLMAFGGSGDGDGEFRHAGRIAVGRDGTIFVASGRDIQVFGPDGTFVRRWGGSGEGRGYFADNISDLVVAPDGRVLATDPGNHRVQVFSPEGHWLEHYGRFDDPRRVDGGESHYRMNIPSSVSIPLPPTTWRDDYLDRDPAADLERLEAIEAAILAGDVRPVTLDTYLRAAQHALNVEGGNDAGSDILDLARRVEASWRRVAAVALDGGSEDQRLVSLADALAAAYREHALRRASLGEATVLIDGYTLASNTHVIVLPDTPTVQERWAARELRHHLERMTGEALSIVRDSEASAEHRWIVVGQSQLLERENLASVDWDGLGEEGIQLESSDGHLVLAGGQRGVLYAVYHFLDAFLGVRWYTPEITTLPSEGVIVVDQVRHRHVPPFELRDPFSFVAYDPDWSVRNKKNAGTPMLNETRGGNFAHGYGVHTFFRLVPPSEFFEDHPEYYSLIDGERRWNHAQLCLTHPEVENIVVERVMDALRNDPRIRVFSVSQNDWAGNCQCDDCAAIDEREGSPAGSMLDFVNRVAERVEVEFPEVWISTLAYQYTRTPPKTLRPRRNVVIRLAPIEANQARPLNDESDPLNAAYSKDLRRWAEIAHRLYIWDYAADFQQNWPQPNLWHLKPNLVFHHENNVRGIRVQERYLTQSELQEERSWLLARMMWDLGVADRALLEDYLTGVYGPAADPIGAYLDLAHRDVTERGVKMGIGWSRRQPALSPKAIAESEHLFDRAESLTLHDATYFDRVRKARLPLMAAAILVENDRDRKAERLIEYRDLAARHGVTHWKEKWDGPSLDQWLYTQWETVREGTMP